jgi:hypothetical protein
MDTEPKAVATEAVAEPAVRAARIEITTEERLAVRELEASFWRGTHDSQKLLQTIDLFNMRYCNTVKSLIKKYDAQEYVWSELDAAFVRITK